MSSGRSRQGRQPIGGLGSLRGRGDVAVPAAVAALLLLAAVGLAQPSGTVPPRWSAPGLRWEAVAMPALGWLAALTVVLTRTAPRPRYRRALRQALLLGAALLLLSAALLGRPPGGVSGGGGPDPRDRLPFELPGLPAVGLPLDPRVLVACFLLLVLAGATLMVWSLWDVRGRLFRRRGRRVRDPRYGRGAEVPAQLEAALDAVRRARAALVSDEEARRAIIAAYAAVERALAERGADRLPAQTPAEFLHAVLASGTLGARREAEALLMLFHRARFSSEPLGEPDRDRAARLLAVLHDDLTGARAGR